MLNKGLHYEGKIRDILIARRVLPLQLLGKLTPTQNDAGFVHKGKEYFLEVKNETAPDYGAKQIIYDPKRKKWKWNTRDSMSDFFDKVGVLRQIPKFVPRKYVKDDKALNDRDKRFDRNNFKQKIDLKLAGARVLHNYYARKNCFYIQIEGKGFYHLLDDRAGLGVPQFIPSVVLRLRAKTHSSTSIHSYSFRVVITTSRQTFGNSKYDIEKSRNFPPIS